MAERDRNLSDPLRSSDPELSALIDDRLTMPIRVVDDVIELMTRVAGLAVRYVDGADYAGITVEFVGTDPFTVAPTDDLVGTFDRSQYRLGDGPCLAAARTGRSVTVDPVEMGMRWPDLAISAHECGITRVVATPLHSRDHSIGSLNLYAVASKSALSQSSTVLVVLVDHLDRGLSAYTDSREAGEHARALRDAVEARAARERKAGVRMELGDPTP